MSKTKSNGDNLSKSREKDRLSGLGRGLWELLDDNDGIPNMKSNVVIRKQDGTKVKIYDKTKGEKREENDDFGFISGENAQGSIVFSDEEFNDDNQILPKGSFGESKKANCVVKSSLMEENGITKSKETENKCRWKSPTVKLR